MSSDGVTDHRTEDEVQRLNSLKRKVALPVWHSELKKYSPRTRFIELDEAFVSYLLSDGVFLPASCAKRRPAASDNNGGAFNQDDWSDAEDDEEDALGSDLDFTALEDLIEEYIKELGGKVFVKLNWSCPKDAAWALGGTVNCIDVEQVFTLLKSSNRIQFDLEACKQTESTPTLCLRTCVNAPSITTFRTFIKDGVPIAASQHDTHTFYRQLVQERQNFAAKITEFLEKVAPKLPLSTLVVDIVFNSERALILDIDVWGEANPLLYEWADLDAMCQSEGSEFQLRIIESDVGIQPSMSLYNSVPDDLSNPQVDWKEALDSVISTTRGERNDQA